MKESSRTISAKKSGSTARANASKRTSRVSAKLWKSILVPTDFSPASYKCLDYAFTLSEMFGAKLTLAHIIVPVAAPDLVYGPVSWDETAATENAMKRLNEIKKERAGERTRHVKVLVRRGHPYSEIDQIAKDICSDLIVVSTHGRSGLRHLLLGSVAERVVRHAPCPVLVVRENEHEFVR